MRAQAAIVLTEVCPYCNRPRSLHEVRPFAGTRICIPCYLSHLEALRVLSDGKPPSECSECHLTYQQLRDRAGLGDNQSASMPVHYENGIYRFLCHACSAEYVRKRRELYGPTEFGHQLGLLR
jgi:hypothetical protein